MESPTRSESSARNGRRRIARPTDTPEMPADGEQIRNPKMEIQLRKEQKLREEEANYTFKPNIGDRRGRDKGENDGNRFDKLYSDALKRHLEGEWKKENEDKDLTFTPNITARARSRSSSRERNGIDRLYSVQTVRSSDAQVQQEFRTRNTFKPEISKRAKSIDRSQERTNIAEKLYQEKENLKLRKEQLQKESDIRAKQQCTFTPKFSTEKSKRPDSTLDVADRLMRFEELKRKKIESKIREKKQREKTEYSFQPRIGQSGSRSRSTTPNSQQRGNGTSSTSEPFYERLAKPIEHDYSNVQEELRSEMTFKPTLSTKRAPSPNARASSYTNIHERLYKEGEARKREAERERDMIREEEIRNLPFKPTINPASRDVLLGDGLDAGPVFERLSTGREQMQDILAKIKYDMEMSQCTFKPHLHPPPHPRRDQSPEHSIPVHLRLGLEGERMKAEILQRQREKNDEEVEGLTFKPSIPASSAAMAKTRASVSLNGDASQDLFSRLAEPTKRHPSAKVDIPVDIGDIYEKKSIALAESDLQQVFRRLSVKTPIRTVSNSDMSLISDLGMDDEASRAGATAGGAGVGDAGGLKRKPSIILNESELDMVFARLSSTETKGRAAGEGEGAGAGTGIAALGSIKRKVLPEKSIDDIVERLSQAKSRSSYNFEGENPLAASKRSISRGAHSRRELESASPMDDSIAALTSDVESTVSTPSDVGAADASPDATARAKATTATSTVTPSSSRKGPSAAVKRSNGKTAADVPTPPAPRRTLSGISTNSARSSTPSSSARSPSVGSSSAKVRPVSASRAPPPAPTPPSATRSVSRSSLPAKTRSTSVGKSTQEPASPSSRSVASLSASTSGKATSSQGGGGGGGGGGGRAAAGAGARSGALSSRSLPRAPPSASKSESSKKPSRIPSTNSITSTSSISSQSMGSSSAAANSNANSTSRSLKGGNRTPSVGGSGSVSSGSRSNSSSPTKMPVPPSLMGADNTLLKIKTSADERVVVPRRKKQTIEADSDAEISSPAPSAALSAEAAADTAEQEEAEARAADAAAVAAAAEFTKVSLKKSVDLSELERKEQKQREEEAELLKKQRMSLRHVDVIEKDAPTPDEFRGLLSPKDSVAGRVTQLNTRGSGNSMQAFVRDGKKTPNSTSSRRSSGASDAADPSPADVSSSLFTSDLLPPADGAPDDPGATIVSDADGLGEVAVEVAKPPPAPTPAAAGAAPHSTTAPTLRSGSGKPIDINSILSPPAGAPKTLRGKGKKKKDSGEDLSVGSLPPAPAGARIRTAGDASGAGDDSDSVSVYSMSGDSTTSGLSTNDKIEQAMRMVQNATTTPSSSSSSTSAAVSVQPQAVSSPAVDPVTENEPAFEGDDVRAVVEEDGGEGGGKDTSLLSEEDSALEFDEAQLAYIAGQVELASSQ